MDPLDSSPSEDTVLFPSSVGARCLNRSAWPASIIYMHKPLVEPFDLRFPLPFPRYLLFLVCSLVPRGAHSTRAETYRPFALSFPSRVMDFDGDLVEILSGAVARKHIVEVRPPAFLYDPKNSEKVAFRHSLVRCLTYFHTTQLSNLIYIQLRR